MRTRGPRTTSQSINKCLYLICGAWRQNKMSCCCGMYVSYSAYRNNNNNCSVSACLLYVCQKHRNVRLETFKERFLPPADRPSGNERTWKANVEKAARCSLGTRWQCVNVATVLCATVVIQEACRRNIGGRKSLVEPAAAGGTTGLVDAPNK